MQGFTSASDVYLKFESTIETCLNKSDNIYSNEATSKTCLFFIPSCHCFQSLKSIRRKSFSSKPNSADFSSLLVCFSFVLSFFAICSYFPNGLLCKVLYTS